MTTQRSGPSTPTYWISHVTGCISLKDCLIGYLNAIAVEHQSQAAETMAFSRIALEVAKCKTRQAARVRDVARQNLIEHCMLHNCWPARDLNFITEASHLRAADGLRLR